MLVIWESEFPYREMEALCWCRDEILLEVARPVRREPTRTTADAQLQGAVEMPQFNPDRVSAASVSTTSSQP
jgi:hypothetical protein